MRAPEGSEPSPIARLSESERALLLAAGKERALAQGELLFAHGALGDEMYLIEEGRIRLIFDEGKEGKVLQAGTLFGEIALLARGSRRTATAVAKDACRLRVVGQAALEELTRSRPELICSLLRETCDYLVRSEQTLTEGLRARNEELERTLDYLRRTREELDGKELLAHTDELTGLYNRRCLIAQVPGFVERAEASGSALSLLLIDLDYFKPINDKHGHAAGDAVLRCIGELLRAIVSNDDLPCRLGGDEFAVVLSDPDATSARQRAADLQRELCDLRVLLPAAELGVSASMGGSLRRPDEGLTALLGRADRSLYFAKESGRGRLAWNEDLPESTSSSS